MKNEVQSYLPADFYEKYGISYDNYGTVGLAMDVRSKNRTIGMCANPKVWESIIPSIICCAWFGDKFGLDSAYSFVQDSNTFLAVTNGVCSFMFFKNLKVPQSRLINTVAASTFGVLLIHANSDTMRQWLWKDTLNNVGAYSTSYFALHAIGSVVGIFVICIVIDYLRIRFLERPFLNRFFKK